MQIKLIKDSVLEIASEQEINQMDKDYESILSGNKNIPLKKLFDLCLYNMIIEEKIKLDIHDDFYNKYFTEDKLRANKALRQEFANQRIKNITIQNLIKSKLSKEDFDLDLKLKELLKLLRIEKSIEKETSKKLIEAKKMKQKILDEINNICSQERELG